MCKNRPRLGRTAQIEYLYLLPALQRAQEGDLIGVFQLAADRDTVGQTRHLDAHLASPSVSGFVAMMTSRISPPDTRASSSRMRRSSGPT